MMGAIDRWLDEWSPWRLRQRVASLELFLRNAERRIDEQQETVAVAHRKVMELTTRTMTALKVLGDR